MGATQMSKRYQPTVMAVDPGSTTGITFRWPTGHVSHAQLPVDEAADFISKHRVDVYVVERFIINAGTVRKSRQGTHDALNLIGFIHYHAQLNGARVVYQTPAMGKRVSDAVLKEQELWWPNHGHANDASRHYYIYTSKERREG